MDYHERSMCTKVILRDLNRHPRPREVPNHARHVGIAYYRWNTPSSTGQDNQFEQVT